MTHPSGIDRESVVAMLAAFGDRAPGSVDDVIGSLELTWLIAQVEQRYAVVLDLADERLGAIRTVDDAARALSDALDSPPVSAAAHTGSGTEPEPR